MDQQRKHTKSEILDFQGLSHYKGFASRHGSVMNESVNESHVSDLRAGHPQEELKIRQELEMEIERDLEEEIKDGICHLALRLYRLYRHRKERKTRSKELETFSDLNIAIKLEGGATKVEIKETKKKAHQEKVLSPKRKINTSRLMSNKKKFDWVNSLRSDSGPVLMSKKIHGSQASLMSDITLK